MLDLFLEEESDTVMDESSAAFMFSIQSQGFTPQQQ
jgi:hypothetical protein